MIINTNIYQTNLYSTKKANINNPVTTNHISKEQYFQDKDIKNDENIWEDLKENYDIRNASFDELSHISTKLYETGEISLKDHLSLTFKPILSPKTKNIENNITQVNEKEKIDWITEFKARAQKQLRLGNYQGYMNKNKMLEILNKLL